MRLQPNRIDPRGSPRWERITVSESATRCRPARRFATATTGWLLSPAMAEEARARNPAVPFAVGDVTALDVPDQTWAGAVAFYSLIHLPRERMRDAFGELRRVLRPGAPLLIAFHVGDAVAGVSVRTCAAAQETHAGEPPVNEHEKGGQAQDNHGRQRQPGLCRAEDDPMTGDDGDTQNRHDPARCGVRRERSGRRTFLASPVIVSRTGRRRDRELQVADSHRATLHHLQVCLA